MGEPYGSYNKKTKKIEVSQDGTKQEYDPEPGLWDKFKESFQPNMLGTPKAEADVMRRRLKKMRGEE